MPKLIEVAFPVEAVSHHASREKSIRHGHPSTLHLWWSRKPLAAARAVLMAQLLDDPSEHPTRFPTVEAQAAERERLLDLIARTCSWAATADPEAMAQVRAEIAAACPGVTVWDPFAGGGSIPLEGQRLGLPVVSSDLNPVAVTVQQVLLAVPRRWQGRGGSADLAADVREAGLELLARATERLAPLYPPVQTPDGPAEATAYLWVRTTTCPSCAASVPMISNPWLRRGRSGEAVWLQAQASEHPSFGFGVGEPEVSAGRGAVFTCPQCQLKTEPDAVRTDATGAGLGLALRCVVAGSGPNRPFILGSAAELVPGADAIEAAVPELEAVTASLQVPLDPEVTNAVRYGLKTVADLHTHRQRAALAVFAAQVAASQEVVAQAKRAQGWDDDEAREYARDVATVLGLVLGRLANRMSTACVWNAQLGLVEQTFIQNNAIALPWDFAEANPLSAASGSWRSQLDWVVRVLERADPVADAHVERCDARTPPAVLAGRRVAVSTDPPYFDYFLYSSLSDFFYTWQRVALGSVLPLVFGADGVDRTGEIVRRGHESSTQDFTDGLAEALRAIASVSAPDLPITLYYGYRTTSARSAAPSGWESLLAALAAAQLCITASWPIRTERTAGVKSSRVSLAASIVLVLRPRTCETALSAQEFRAQVGTVIPAAVQRLQRLHIPPADLLQAALGPGMSVYTAHASCELSAAEAVAEISAALSDAVWDAALDLDAVTRFALGWFDRFGDSAGPVEEAMAAALAVGVGEASLAEVLDEAGALLECPEPGDSVWAQLLHRDPAMPPAELSEAEVVLGHAVYRSADRRNLKGWTSRISTLLST